MRHGLLVCYPYMSRTVKTRVIPVALPMRNSEHWTLYATLTSVKHPNIISLQQSYSNATFDRALILLDLGLCFLSTSISSVFVVLCIFNFFVKFFTLPFSELSIVGLALDLVD